jgi:hypothetical protein
VPSHYAGSCPLLSPLCSKLTDPALRTSLLLACSSDPAGGSPVRFSRAGRLGSSPGRTTAALSAGRTTADRDSRLSIGATAGTPSWQIQAGSATPEPPSSTAAETPRRGRISSSSAAAGAAGEARRQPGQYSSLLRGRAAAVASPTEQQGLWSGARSAPEEAAALAGARGLLLRRGAQLLEPISTSSGPRYRRSTGSRGGAESAVSPSGSDAGAALLPYGADSSAQG